MRQQEVLAIRLLEEITARQVRMHEEQERMHADLHEIKQTLHQLHTESRAEMATLDALTAEVNDSTTITASVLALVQSLADQITAAGTDPVALQALVDQLHANDAALAAAVQANTPAPPDPNA